MLGECAYANLGFTRFEPHLRLGSKGVWNRVVDPSREYPDEGKIFSRDPRALDAPKGSLWTFRVEPNPRSDAGGRSRDKLMAREVWPATRIVDLSRDSWEAARYKIVEEGLPRSIGYLVEALILLADNACVRLCFTSDDTGEVWQPRPEMLPELSVFRWDTSVGSGATIEGASFLVPGTEPKEVIDTLDWSPNDEFLPRVLKRIRRAGHGDMGTLTNAAVDALTSFLKARGMMPGDDPALRRMRRRLQDFLPGFDPNDDQLDAMVTALELHRPVAVRLSEALEQQRLSLEQQLTGELTLEIRARLEAEERFAADRLESALKDAAEAEAMQAEALSRAEAARLEVAAVENSLTHELAELQAALAAAPPGAGARAAAIASTVSAALNGTRPGTTILPSTIPPWAEARVEVAPPVTSVDLASRFETEGRAAGIRQDDLADLDAILRSGEIALLLGGGVSAALSAYARCVSGGRITRFTLDPSIIGLDDLWRQAASGVPTPLAHSWNLASSHPSVCVLLVLDAINAAPLEFWLPSLKEALRSSGRPRNLLVAATASACHWTARIALNDLTRAAVPFSLANPPDFIRAALLRTGSPTTTNATMYASSEGSDSDPKALVELVSHLKEMEVEDSEALMRSFHVQRTAVAVYPPERVLELALNVARLSASMEERVTGSIAHGLTNLRSLLSHDRE